MPVLPLSHTEPFAAVLGVMLHPLEEDQAKAEAFASQYLAAPLKEFHRRGGELPYSDLRRIAEGAGQPLTDLENRWYQATAAGQILKTYFGLFNTDPDWLRLPTQLKLRRESQASIVNPVLAQIFMIVGPDIGRLLTCGEPGC